jgi:paraquat-inducible protein A
LELSKRDANNLTVKFMPPNPGLKEPDEATLIECPDCSAMQLIKSISSGRLQCRRCGNTLERATGRSITAALACGAATFVLLFPANLLPLLHFSYAGIESGTRVPDGIAFLWHEGWVLAAAVVALQVMILPFLRYGLLIVALEAIRVRSEKRWIGPCFRWAEKLDAWAMPDVFLIGCAIGYSRIAPYAPVAVDNGGWCMIGAAFMAMMTRASLDRRYIWKSLPPMSAAAPLDDHVVCPVCDLMIAATAEGARCPRCRQRVWRRKPFATTYAAALTIAAFVLFPVAYLYPMSSFSSPFVHTSHTIFDGVRDLVNAGLWPLACLIFTASIAIPFAKLAAMSWFLLSIKARSTQRLTAKTRAYRVIDDLGRWSNIDVYTIAVFTPMVQFGQLASFHAGMGTPAFLAVVVLTMLASETFDPRLLWDCAGPMNE